VVLGVVPHLSAFQHPRIELRHQEAAIYKIPLTILVNVPFSYIFACLTLHIVHDGMSDVRALSYGPRLTGPSFLIFLWARTSQNLARKADTPRHTGPT
jgi:hypothetical protein